MSIDLGKTPEHCEPCCGSKPSSEKAKKYYPTAYVSGIKGLDLDIGDTGTCSFRVVGVQKRNGSDASYDIELVSMDADGGSGDGLDGALEKIEKKKAPAKKVEDDMEDDE